MSQRSRLIETGTDHFETRGLMPHGTVGILTDPNDVRYVGSQAVRHLMDLEDDAWDHREPT